MKPEESGLRSESTSPEPRSGWIGKLSDWLLLAWIATIPVMHPFNLRLARRYTLPPADFLFVPALLLFFAALVSGVRRWRPRPWHWPLLAYSGALLLSTFASQNVRQSAPKLAGDLYLVIAAALVANYVRSEETLRRAVFAWIAGTVATVAGVGAGLILFLAGRTKPKTNPLLTHFGTLPPGHYPRIRSLFLDANMMCSYMAVAAMIIVAARQAGWISARTFRLLLAATIFAAAFSISPGLGGLCLALALWSAPLQPTPLRARLVAWAGWAIAAVVFIGAPISMTPLTRMSVYETVIHAEPSGRLLTWTGAWHTFLAHPLFGQGLESESAHVHYITASGPQFLTDAHNTWLSIMAQQGLAGLLAFAWVVGYLIRRSRYFAAPTGVLPSVRASLELALLGGFLYSSLTGSLENTRHVWALMGIVAAVQDLPGTACQ